MPAAVGAAFPATVESAMVFPPVKSAKRPPPASPAVLFKISNADIAAGRWEEGGGCIKSLIHAM